MSNIQNLSKFIFFDIETTGLDPEKCQFKCAVAKALGKEPLVFTTASKFAAYLAHDDNKATTFVTHNGLHFDFQVMFNQCTNNTIKQRLQTIAVKQHVDTMFAFLVEHGYPASMESFANELGLAKSWNGKEAAAPCAPLKEVVEYCKHDVRILEQVFCQGTKCGMLSRKSKAGKMLTWVLPEGRFLTVAECTVLWKQAPANQSWMTTPFEVMALRDWTNVSVHNYSSTERACRYSASD